MHSVYDWTSSRRCLTFIRSPELLELNCNFTEMLCKCITAVESKVDSGIKCTEKSKMFHCLQDRIPLRIQNMFEKWHCASTCISRRSQWVLSPVWSRPTRFWTAQVLGTPSAERPEAELVKEELEMRPWSSHHFATHVFIFAVWDQDVHLWALGTDDVAAHRVLAQVHLAAVGLVDGDGRDSSQNLEMKRVHVMANIDEPCCSSDVILKWDISLISSESSTH